ncbi:MAG: PP2C family protein-serine/threonine phosphatase [Verrucomicrobiales bacterium]
MISLEHSLLILLGALLIVIACGWRSSRRQVARLRIEREELRLEEARVFDFLHGLGEAFSDTIRTADLHRLVVEGTMRIFDAHGGVLYLLDRSNSFLVPSFVSKGALPLVPVPAHILEQAELSAVAIESYLRLQSIGVGDGLVGAAWARGESALIDRASLRFLKGEGWKSEWDRFLPSSAMVAPLTYARQNIGVLVVNNSGRGSEFLGSDFQVFKSIAEQSAFALYSALVFSDANEKKRLEHDLDIARDIQRILLPSIPPTVPGFELSGMNIPAQYVSGDYFDFIHVDQDRLGVVVADVSGKGVPASLIMAMCRSVLRTQAMGNPSPADVLRRVNAHLYPDIKEDMFISVAYLILNHATGEIAIARAGHDPPLFYHHGDGSITKLCPAGMAIGIDSGDVFSRITKEIQVPMQSQDCLLLYTDGITEALDRQGDEFGLERLIHGVKKHATKGASNVVKQLNQEVRGFAGEHPQSDDITLIALRKN